MWLSVGKVKFDLYISSDVAKRFRELVALKHGCSHGALSFEAETAFNQYMATYHIQQQSTKQEILQRANPIPKVHHLKQEIYKFLIDSGMYMTWACHKDLVRVDGFKSVDFALFSDREIDPNAKSPLLAAENHESMMREAEQQVSIQSHNTLEIDPLASEEEAQERQQTE